MKEYTIIVKVTLSKCVKVEASSKKKALKIADEELSSLDYDDWGYITDYQLKVLNEK